MPNDNHIVWTDEMTELLAWMRSQRMPVHFCAEVIGREMGVTLTKKACEMKLRRMRGVQ